MGLDDTAKVDGTRECSTRKLEGQVAVASLLPLEHSSMLSGLNGQRQ